ncbi:MAG: helix-turn-helix transcriptional regulator [Clostridia bacterium]|nr:helix-turn-helix transcriptional regulator [Clostridia bacterium]
MDQIKIGKFIAVCRKKENLTQAQLAEKLNITDRAVSKWETGKAMPDSSIMLELCDVLRITVNDLLSGEVVSMDNYNKESEKNLMEMVKQKEKADERLLATETVLGAVGIILCLAIIFVACYVPMTDWLRIVLFCIGFIFIFVIAFCLLKIEQVAGYYECKHCHHKYVPTYNAVLWAMHTGRTRYMKCPECNKMSWQKKVISKE